METEKQNILQLLKFYQNSGVEFAISEDNDWKQIHQEHNVIKENSAVIEIKSQLTQYSEPALKQHEVVKSVTTKEAVMVTSMMVNEARKLADMAGSIEDLKAALMNFEGCSLKKYATNTVFADSNPDSEVMLIGEAPGASEDEQGIPFCGASGKLLDKMLASINLDRKSNIYISNTIFWRPPGNRVPTKEELAICLPFVEKHIALVNPKRLIFCGGTAATHMLSSTVGIMKLRGKFYPYINQYLKQEVEAAVLFHPSFLLRQPGQKRQTWHDLQMIEQKLNNG